MVWVTLGENCWGRWNVGHWWGPVFTMPECLLSVLQTTVACCRWLFTVGGILDIAAGAGKRMFVAWSGVGVCRRQISTWHAMPSTGHWWVIHSATELTWWRYSLGESVWNCSLTSGCRARKLYCESTASSSPLSVWRLYSTPYQRWA